MCIFLCQQYFTHVSHSLHKWNTQVVTIIKNTRTNNPYKSDCENFSLVNLFPRSCVSLHNKAHLCFTVLNTLISPWAMFLANGSLNCHQTSKILRVFIVLDLVSFIVEDNKTMTYRSNCQEKLYRCLNESPCLEP